MSPSPSKSNANANETSTDSGMEPTSGKPATVSKTQDRTKKKNSVEPAGSWLFGDRSKSITEENKPEKPDKKTSLASTGSPGSENKKGTIGDDNSGMQPTSGKPAAVTTSQDRTKKKNSVGPGGSWLFGDQSEFVTEDGNPENPGNKNSLGSTRSGGSDNKKGTFGDDNTTPSTKNSLDDNHKASLTNAAVSINQENKSAPKNIEHDKTKEDAEEKKEDAHGKVSSWHFGNGKNKDTGEVNTQENEDRKKVGGEGYKDNGTNNGGGIGPAKNENPNKEAEGQEKDAVKKDLDNDGEKEEDRRNIEMIDEEDEDNDDDDDDDDGEEDEDDANGDEGNEGNATDAAGSGKGARKTKGGRRRKKIGYGKLKWNAASKVDTGSSSYVPRKSVKKIPNFKNDYSHVRSRLSTVSESNTGSEKATENPLPQRQRSVSISKAPLPDYSNVRPRLYNGGRRYNSEMPSTVPTA